MVKMKKRIWVKGYKRNGKRIKGHWRKVNTKSVRKSMAVGGRLGKRGDIIEVIETVIARKETPRGKIPVKVIARYKPTMQFSKTKTDDLQVGLPGARSDFITTEIKDIKVEPLSRADMDELRSSREIFDDSMNLDKAIEKGALEKLIKKKPRISNVDSTNVSFIAGPVERKILKDQNKRVKRKIWSPNPRERKTLMTLTGNTDRSNLELIKPSQRAVTEERVKELLKRDSDKPGVNVFIVNDKGELGTKLSEAEKNFEINKPKPKKGSSLTKFDRNVLRKIKDKYEIQN